jgi:hypothetical protein
VLKEKKKKINPYPFGDVCVRPKEKKKKRKKKKYI